MERPSPALLSVLAAVSLSATPACAPEVDGVKIEIGKMAFRALETGVRGCQVEDAQWQPATPKTKEQGLIIPHPNLSTVKCLQGVEEAWSPKGTHSTLSTEKDPEGNLVLVVKQMS